MTPASQQPDDADTAVLDEVFDRAVRAFAENTPLDLADLASPHGALTPRIDAIVRLARRVTLVQPLTAPVVAGYDLLEELGAGGMGVVWLARQRTLGRLVALKVLPPAAAASSHGRARFATEARALARVRHPALVQVFDVVAADAVCAYAMELVEGRSLAQILAGMRGRGGRDTAAFFAELGVEAAERAPLHIVVCRLFVQVLRALAALHAAGLVHRDVKPSNILVRSDGQPALTDLGLVLDEAAPELTRTGQFVGTPAYAAPEQLRGERAGPATDVWAAGVSLFEALTRVHPFAARDPGSLRARITGDAGTRLRAVDKTLPRDLETIVDKATAHEPAQRYGTADDFADDLERLLSLQPIQAVPASGLVRAGKAMRRHRGLLLAAALGGVAAVLVGALLVLYLVYRSSLPERSAEAVRRARLHLLLPTLSEQTLIAVRALPGQHAPRLRHAESALERAVATYEEAARLWQLEPTAAVELEVARAARGQTPRLHETGVACPLTATVVRGATFPAAGDPRLVAASREDRRALGLLAFLRAETQACHAAWTGLDLSADAPDPLVDAARGTLHLIEDRPALALPRLLAARAAFPEAGFLCVDAADAACRVGDLELAERLLLDAEPLGLQDPYETRLSVRMDVAAARGRLDDALAVLAELETRHQANASRARMATHLSNAGRWGDALRLWLELQQDAPWFDVDAEHLVAALDAWWAARSCSELAGVLTATLPSPVPHQALVELAHQYGGSRRDLPAKWPTPASTPSAPELWRPDWRDLELTLELVRMDSFALWQCKASARLSLIKVAMQVDSPLITHIARRIGGWAPAVHCLRRLLARPLATAARVSTIVSALVSFGITAPMNAQSCVSVPGAVLWLPFDEAAGSVTTDVSAAGRTGSLVGPAAFASGKVGRALDLSSAGARVDIVPLAGLRYDEWQVQTIEFWINWGGDRGIGSPNRQYIWDMQDDNFDFATSPFAVIVIDEADQGSGAGLKAIGRPGLFGEAQCIAPLPTVGTWEHYACTFNKAAGGISIFKNGLPVASIPWTPYGTPNSQTGRIGTINPAYGSADYHFAGLLDEFTIYNRALTAAEIQSIFAAGSAGKCRTDLVDAAQSTVDSNASLLSAYSGQATITVTPKNVAGTPLGTGLTVALTTTAGTLLGTVTDNNDGTYTQLLQAVPGSDAATVSATVNSIAITDTATITFVPVDPTETTVTVSPDATFLGGHAVVRVTPKDNLGAMVGAGLTVQLQTTLGALAGSITDDNDGTYSQRLDATQLGTAAITATVNGLPLPPAALTILDGSIGAVIGLRNDHNALPYDSIQQAVNRAPADQLVRILVNPGTYDEVVHLRNRSNLRIEGLSSLGLVTVRGFRLSDCEDITIAYFDVDGSQRARHGVKLLGGCNRNQHVTVHDCFIHDVQGTHDGIRIGRDNCHVTLRNLRIERSGGDGISMADGPCEATITDVTVLSSGLDGIRTADEATVRIERCRIEDSGTRGREREGYGIFRQRHRTGFATLITLLENTFAGNRGRVVAGKSTANLGNHDQILDATDAQSGF